MQISYSLCKKFDANVNYSVYIELKQAYNYKDINKIGGAFPGVGIAHWV